MSSRRHPAHVYRGKPTSVARLAALAGVAWRTMARRLLILTPEEAVELGPVATADREAAAAAVPRRRYLYLGEPCTIARLAELAGCTVDAMRCRLDHGRTPEEAVRAGALIRGSGPVYEWRGRPITGAELAALAGCPPGTMYRRLNRGIEPERAVAMGRSGRPGAAG